MLSNDYVMAAGVAIAEQSLASYKDFPPSQRPASFTIDQAIEKLKQGFAK
jgi:arylsulfatase